ncbi:hypothetical protein ACWIWK_06950 [Helicobacter sp. 23-1048]
MTRTFNKIGKIVAVSIGIVLMGAVFASTKAETTDNVIECSGNEIKTDTSIEKGECEDGKRKGVWKYYDKDGYIQKEITWQNGEIVLQKEYDKNENPKLTTAYNKGKVVSKRKYGYDNGVFLDADQSNEQFLTHYYTEDNVSVEREYSIASLIRQTNNKIYEARKEAAKIAEQRAQSKVKKPTMQEVKRAKDRGQDAMKTYREKLNAQYEKEWQIELAKIPTMPNFDSYSNDELITYIKNNKIFPMREVIKFVKFSPTIEGDTTENLILLWEDDDGPLDIHFEDTKKSLGKIYEDSAGRGFYCEDKGINDYTCRTFAKHYKQLIDKSAYKNMIYKVLPKPKNL